MINPMATFDKSRLYIALLLFAVCLLTFYNSLGNPFIMDDHALITRNRAIKDPGFLHLGKGSFQPGGENLYFRPLAHVFNLIPFLLFGLDPVRFHLFNLFLFYFMCVSIFVLIEKLFRDRAIAFLTAFLFATHPVNGVIVNYLTTSGYAVMVIAMNLSLIWYFMAVEKNRPMYHILSLCAFAIALLGHEIAVMLPFYLAAAIWFKEKPDFIKLTRSTLTYLIILFLYLLLRLKVASLKSGVIDHISAYSLNGATFMASYANLLLFYLKNLLCLNNIVLIWTTPVIKENALPVSALFLVIISGIFYLSVTKWKNDARSLAALWFLAGILPVALACFSRPNLGLIIEPHWLFYPSIAFFIFLSYLIFNISKRSKGIAFSLIILFLTSYLLSSWRYNALWDDEKKYPRYMLSLSPGMDFPQFWLADAYLREGDLAKAEGYYRRSLRGRFSDWQNYINLGLIEDLKGHPSEAINYYAWAIKINPKAAVGYSNIAAILIEQGDLNRAKPLLEKAILSDYYLLEARKNLAYLYILEGKKQTALAIYQKILSIDPKDRHAREKILLLNQTR